VVNLLIVLYLVRKVYMYFQMPVRRIAGIHEFSNIDYRNEIEESPEIMYIWIRSSHNLLLCYRLLRKKPEYLHTIMFAIIVLICTQFRWVRCKLCYDHVNLFIYLLFVCLAFIHSKYVSKSCYLLSDSLSVQALSFPSKNKIVYISCAWISVNLCSVAIEC